MKSLIRKYLLFLAAISISGAGLYGGIGGCSSCGMQVQPVTPSVVSTSPADKAVDVKVDAVVEIAFNEDMDLSSFNDETFNVITPDGTLVSGDILPAPTPDKVYFVASSNFNNYTIYAAHVSKDVLDADGNSMAADYDWTFTTVRGSQKIFTAELDPDFATGGTFSYDFGNTKDDVGNAVLVQPDGKIIQSGYVNYTGVGSHDADIGVIRLDENGNFDPTFGTGGSVVIDCNSFWGLQWWIQQGLAFQSDGKIIVGGECARKATVFRLNSDGSIDDTFGTAGRADIAKDIAGGEWTGDFSLAVQPDGGVGEKVIMGAIANTVPDWAVQPVWMLARFNADGTLDNTFGDQPAHPGIIIEGWGSTSSDGIRDMVILDDRSIIGYGNTYTDATAMQDFAVAKFSADGVLDTSFGTNGITVINFGGVDWSYSVTRLEDGRIAAGEHVNCCFATSRFGVFLLTPEGVLDSTFGTTGEVVIDFGTNEQQIGNAIVALPDGRLIIGGEVNNGAGGWDNNDFGLTMLNTDGTVEAQFGTNGFITTDFYGLEDGILKMRLEDVEIDSSGNVTSFSIVASGVTKQAGHADRDFALARYVSIPVEIITK